MNEFQKQYAAPVSYTHLDVYKRQGRYAVLAPEEHAHIAGNVAKHAAQRLVGDVLGVVFAQVMLDALRHRGRLGAGLLSAQEKRCV